MIGKPLKQDKPSKVSTLEYRERLDTIRRALGNAFRRQAEAAGAAEPPIDGVLVAVDQLTTLVSELVEERDNEHRAAALPGSYSPRGVFVGKGPYTWSEDGETAFARDSSGFLVLAIPRALWDAVREQYRRENEDP